MRSTILFNIIEIKRTSRSVAGKMKIGKKGEKKGKEKTGKDANNKRG